MLRSLLLLCWAATIVSAGIYKNDISNTSVPGNLVGDNVATNSELPLETSKLSLIKEDAHMPSVLSESNKPVTLETSNENISSNDSMTALSTINSTTTSTIETKSISTTSTSKPTTTSTSKPTTTSTSKPTTSTPIPTTTPIPSTTIPVPTTPLPPPSTGTWQIRQDNKLCIMIQMAAQFNVSYNNATISFHKAMDIPTNSNATGNCSEQTEQTLTLSWGSKNNSTLTAQNNFTLHFVKNEPDKLYSLHHFEISLAVEKTPTDKSNKTVTVMTMAPQFSTGLNNSYRCLKEQSLNLIFKGENKTVGELKISKLQFQAFRNDNTTTFGLAKDCSFDTPDIVPITVGCALAGLVVVVLIAYLVGRRRSQSRGYLSM
ncbi:lysosome-associated membrane glycoprotein 1-like [Cataglyphis hispanica]|uniref:lysosome-associated membrane glycoprotein 1-like n=1 Tax=Cataglyphis hispanica TaxID=1086592 RepID=UPI0021807722|nr:lysosome-associated membrane glycoprotein 1-like [Cataglyphis hispanica]